MGVRSEPHKSNLGNLFYVNDVRDLIAKDFSNPEVAPHIQKYPEDVNGGSISEIWQVELGRWHNIPLDELTPSILIGYKRYYIHEVAELSDGHWVIPALWIVCQGKTYADCHLVEMSRELQVVQSVKPEIVRISLDKFSYTHEDLVERLGAPIAFTNTFHNYSAQIPNKFRTIDNGEDSMEKICSRFGSLSGQMMFLVPEASSIRNTLIATHQEPVRTYNAETSRPCSFRLNVPDGPADNPLQAEEASHIGHQGNHFCRRCKVGRTSDEKECPNGYHSFYEAGQPRSVEEIRSCILTQLSLATYGVAARVEELQTATGTKDEIAQHWIDILIQKSREMQATNPGRLVDDISTELLIWSSKETDQPYNPLLDLSYFDPSQDTLVEILHTILLGNAKYTWYELHHNWTPVQQNIFTIRLQSTNLDGLHVPPIRAAYMMQS
ncbi:hypothetical protein B0H10DRAFT_1957038 [Mycena sp. CBHHK59/15]|nr:hypothetical protein B0H10DRAFT_1957038 [Mycena sp. CBHHK59/15]